MIAPEQTARFDKEAEDATTIGETLERYQEQLKKTSES
jgi:hypothetical protein